MSHKYPFRRPPSDSDLRPDPGPYSSSDLRHVSPDHSFYRPPQESFSSSYPSSSSSRGSAQWSQDVLSSCGLEPSDLSLLAELPEDVLTVESLPHVLNHIKGKRGTVKPFPPSAPSSSSSSSSYPPCSSSRPAVSSYTRDWDQLQSQPVRYPLDHVPPSPLASEQLRDRWGNPRTNRSVRADPPSSSSSSSIFKVDFQHRPGPPEYGKTGRATGPVSSQGRPSFRSADQGKRSRASRFFEPGSAPPPEEYDPKPRWAPLESETSSIGTGRHTAAASMPSKKEALDFHGTCPQVFPYSCALCDITVLSERVWTKHINGTHHADGQLSLLQRFPNWDCRVETISRADSQSEKWKDEEKPAQLPQTVNESQKSQPKKLAQNKGADKGKVVCVRFPAQSVDETYLRKLTEPFGKIVKILMFPSLAFVELGSVDQAKDLVKFHVNYPPTVNGERIEFHVSNTFSFLQSSQVVRFTPAPTGEDGQSDLLSVIKRFGPPLYTLFLPTTAFVEMKNVPDAQKLVDYYSSNTLRLNNDVIKVSFSAEYKSLTRVPSATRYEDKDTSCTKRTRSQSRDEEGRTTETKRRRSGSKDGAEEGGTSGRKRRTGSRSTSRERRTRTRSTSREKSSRKRKTRSRSRSREKSSTERKTRSRSKDESSRERKLRSRSGSRDKKSREKSSGQRRSKSRSRSKSRDQSKSRDKSRERSSRERRNTRSRSRSRSRDKSTSRSLSQNRSRSREKTVGAEKPEKPDSESRTDAEPGPRSDSKPETAEREEEEEEEESSAEESDIEGMEVIGEDGENLEDEDVEPPDDAEEEEEEEEQEAAEENKCPAEGTDSPEEEKGGEDGETGAEDKPVTEQQDSETTRETEETSDTQLEDDEEEPDFPVDLENCITLDEVDEDQSDDQEPTGEPESLSTRVVHFGNLPLRFYTDAEFVALVKGFGKAVRYFLIRRQQQGFIEMSTSSEAVRAAKEMTSKRATFHGSKLNVHISQKYSRLTNWWDVPSDSDLDEEKRSERRSRSSSRRRSSERRNKSKTSDRDETCRTSEGTKESSKTSPVQDPGSKKSTHTETTDTQSSGNVSVSTKTPEKESTPEKEVTPPQRKTSSQTPDKDSASKHTTDKESKNTEDSASRNPPEGSEETPEQDKFKRTNEKQDPEPETPPQRQSAAVPTEQGPTGTDAPDKAGTSEDEETPQTEGATSEPAAQDSEKSPDQPDSTADPPKPQTEQKPDDQLQDSDDVDKLELKPGPVGGTAEPEKPTKPVGTEFVRPVVGYFCHLCEVIYADEDEAKVQHCSSPTHYRKYQEKTGKDPWTS